MNFQLDALRSNLRDLRNHAFHFGACVINSKAQRAFDISNSLQNLAPSPRLDLIRTLLGEIAAEGEHLLLPLIVSDAQSALALLDERNTPAPPNPAAPLSIGINNALTLVEDNWGTTVADHLRFEIQALANQRAALADALSTLLVYTHTPSEMSARDAAKAILVRKS